MALHRLLPVVVAIVAAVDVQPAPVAASQQPVALEADVKAAFLYNFTKFIDWPAAAFRSDLDSFRVCALADEEFVRTLSVTLKGETVRGRPLELVVPEAPQIPQCHILFIGETEFRRVGKVMPLISGKPVLAVSETPKFLELGGTVNFVRENDRVRFDVDLASAQRSGLAISSKLLRVARSVRERRP